MNSSIFCVSVESLRKCKSFHSPRRRSQRLEIEELIIIFNLIKEDLSRQFLLVGNFTNWMWFSVVCTLIENDVRHHSGQNIVSGEAQYSRVHNKFWLPWWRVSLTIRVQKKLNHIWFVNFTTISASKEMLFFPERVQDGTHWREQRCLDSYRQRQISQSDYEISNNCGKNPSCDNNGISHRLALHNHAIKIDFDVSSHAQYVNSKVEMKSRQKSWLAKTQD